MKPRTLVPIIWTHPIQWELIGTQPQPGDIERALAECDAKCENTSIVDW